MIVTIDGPAGAGKSTAARELAKRLGFEYLDTGAMYRAVTLAGVEAGLDFQDEAKTAELLQGLTLQMLDGRVVLNGRDVTGLIRTQAVTEASGAAASSRVVRQRLVHLQREHARGRRIVCEGRDQGTVVFPEARCKFFLIAQPVERARRRLEELKARGEAASLEGVLAAQHARDERDAARDLGPMVPAAEARMVDSTALSLEEVVALMERDVRQCLSG